MYLLGVRMFQPFGIYCKPSALNPKPKTLNPKPVPSPQSSRVGQPLKKHTGNAQEEAQSRKTGLFRLFRVKGEGFKRGISFLNLAVFFFNLVSIFQPRHLDLNLAPFPVFFLTLPRLMFNLVYLNFLSAAYFPRQRES